MNDEEHADRRDDAAAYALGALTEDEALVFAAHLRECAACREEVASLQHVADSLAGGRAPAERAGGAARARARDGRIRGRAAQRERAPGRGAPRARTARTVAVALRDGRARARPRRGRGRDRRLGRAEPAGDPGPRLRRRAPPRRCVWSAPAASSRSKVCRSPPKARSTSCGSQRGHNVHATDALFNVTSAGRASVGVPGQPRRCARGDGHGRAPGRQPQAHERAGDRGVARLGRGSHDELVARPRSPCRPAAAGARGGPPARR